jgi:DNA polymerase-3 subunit gamma/tau
MSYTVLARRYRSGTFDEVIGQDHVAKTLKRAITSGRIAHAYLFCGTRGTGKTSMARIMAKALNCSSFDAPTTEPCGKCESCLAIARGDDIDVIEIDAASNTGVDNIRELIENSQYRPARSRFKVYIIDEVHMLSKSAFNALLKTLEEPPSHVKFILATTEPEKVLPTILSRCQRYDFRNIPTREIAGHLSDICKKEKIKADDDALLLVAKAGAGSMRDALSLLDRLLSVGEKHVSSEMVEQLLGLPRAEVIFNLAAAMGAGDVKQALTQASEILVAGLSTDALLGALTDHLRNLLILRTCGPDSTLVEAPGLSLTDLSAQADQFDPAALTQDITILEELRRNARHSQAARALIDATLVRLTLADQFSSIGELIARLDGQPAPPRPAQAPSAPAAAAFAAQKKNDAPIGAPLAPALEPVATAAVSVVEEEDDLPRPGKVWENTGPSLSELLKAEAAKTATVAVAMEAAVAGELDPDDLGQVWQRAVSELAEPLGPMVHSVITKGRLSAIDEGQAVIHFNAEDSTLVKTLDRNGRKEALQRKLSELMKKTVGVRFQFNGASEDPAPAAQPATAKARESAPSRAPEPPPTPAVPTIKITPELIETLREEPLVKALMDKMAAQVVKVE